jgi:hypothetical protein
MPRRRRVAKRRGLGLDEEFALWLGLRLEVFASDRELEECWSEFGEQVMAERHWPNGRPGERVYGWWLFDAGDEQPDRADFPDTHEGLLPAANELDGSGRFEVARVVFLAERHMGAAEARAFVEREAGDVRPPHELSGDYFGDGQHTQAVRLIGAVMDALPDVDFTDLLGDRLGWLVLGPGSREESRAQRESKP